MTSIEDKLIIKNTLKEFDHLLLELTILYNLNNSVF